jgi:hypothetical protein
VLDRKHFPVTESAPAPDAAIHATAG